MNEEKKAKRAKEMEDSTKKMRDALRSEFSATPGEVHVDKFKKMQKSASEEMENIEANVEEEVKSDPKLATI